MRALDAALSNASQWLHSAQSSDGSWHDFWTPSRVSDEWVTAYVGASLAASSGDEQQMLARAAWKYLTGRVREPAGWGYSADVPSDADSTTWALLLAGRIGEATSAIAIDALVFLRESRVPGGVSTYADPTCIQRYLQATDRTDFSGWTSAHLCVTGAAAQLPALRVELTSTLLSAQRDDGSWPSYWWFEDAYATAMAACALHAVPSLEARDAVDRARSWACRKLEGETSLSPFVLSLVLLILAAGEEYPEATHKCALLLLAKQEPTGFWRGSAALRIPPPDAVDPLSVTAWRRWWGSGIPFSVFSVDQCSVFTTATAYVALSAFASEKQCER